MADLQHPRWEKPGKLWSLPLRDVAGLDAFQLRWAIRIIRIPVKDIEFSSCHFVIPWACKLIEHLQASSCCTAVSFALPPVPFAPPPCASVTPISARYIRQFLSSLSWFPIMPRRHNPWRFYTTPMWDVMWNIPYFLHVLLALHCNRSRLPTPVPIVNSNLGALCPLIPLLPLLLPHHPDEAYPSTKEWTWGESIPHRHPIATR